MRINFYIPQKFNKLNSRQLLKLGNLLSKQTEISERRFLYTVLSILLVPKFTFKNIIKTMYLFSQVPLSELKEYCKFITEKTDVLTKFPKKFKINGTWIYGPADRLANLTIEEFSYADGFYFNWVTKHDPLDLDRLVSVIYRRKGNYNSESDIRMPFNKLTLANQARFAEKIPAGYKIIIALAFQGSREKIYSRYPIVFPKSKTTENAAKAVKYEPLTKIIKSMAMDETQILGALQHAEKTDIATFFDVYQEALIRQRERN